MSKTRTIRLNVFFRVILLALVGFLLLLIPGIIGVFTIIIVVAIFGWVLWSDGDRIKELERRLATLEKAEPKSEEA